MLAANLWIANPEGKAVSKFLPAAAIAIPTAELLLNYTLDRLKSLLTNRSNKSNATRNKAQNGIIKQPQQPQPGRRSAEY